MPDISNIDYLDSGGFQVGPATLQRELANVDYIIIEPLVDPMPFPITKRYFLDFRNSDTGLTPTFTFLQVTPGFGPTSPASPVGGIVEKSNGRYYFDWIWLTKTDSDIVFQVDGGASIPTEEVRYIKGTISPRDVFLDDPISDVPAAVWSDSASYGAGEKGLRVDQLGDPADLSSDPTLFGKTLLYKESVRGDTAGTSDGNDVEQVYDVVAAVQTDLTTANTALTDIKGSGFNTATDSLKIVSDNVDAINIETDAASIATAVWDRATASHVTAGTFGKLEQDTKTAVDAINVETDAASIADAVWDAATAGNIGAGTMGGLVNDAASGSSSAAAIADAVWDEAISTHTLNGSFGQTLQLLNNDTAAAGGATTITLGASAVGTLDFYKNALLVITGGTGAGQARAITEYTALKVATVDRAWGLNPDNTSQYIVLPAANVPVDNASIADAVWDELTAGHAIGGSFAQLELDTKTAVDAINIETDAASIATAVWDRTLSSHTTVGTFGQTLQLSDTGTLQAGAASTATLKLAASAIDDFYNNGLLVITSGTGISQSRSITDYDGTTKIATVDRPWGTIPLVGAGYMVVPAAPSSSLTVGGIADAVWDEQLSGHLSMGSAGEKLNTGAAATPYVQFEANGDTDLPIIVQVASPTHTTVRVTYSEAVVMTGGANGALNVANYTIPGLTISGIVSLTAQQVLLTTSAQTPNFLYTLTVVNVEDTQGNPIA